MRIPSGKTDQSIYFVAVDATDYVTRETGLTGFTVVRSRNGAADVTYTTPTVTEVDSTTMPGVYALLIDEDTTIASGSDSEEYCVHITKTGMAPVTRTIELYRRDTTTGRTLDVSAGGEAGIDWANIGSPTTAVNLSATNIDVDQIVASVSGAVGSVTGAVGSVTGAVGSVTGNVGGNVTGSVGSIAANGLSATSIASNAFTSAKFAAGAFDNVWTVTVRTLTANTNLNDLSAAGIRTAVGLASANLDTQLDALPTNAELATALGTADDAVLAAISGLSIPTANQNADALLDRANGVETSMTLRQAQRIILSATAGKASGLATTTAKYRDTGDTKDRITATVDADGNRSAVTLDAT